VSKSGFLGAISMPLHVLLEHDVARGGMAPLVFIR
jgi:hypothetical protein